MQTLWASLRLIFLGGLVSFAVATCGVPVGIEKEKSKEMTGQVEKASESRAEAATPEEAVLFEPLAEATPEPPPEARTETPSLPEPRPEPLPEPLPEPRPEPLPEPKTPRGVRFIAIGDTGTASASQLRVALGIKKVCDHESLQGRGPCDFGILLGDNFYNTGVSDENDPQFKSKFSDIYHPLGFPFYITIGNHDYGAEGAGLEVQKLQHYLNYAKKDPRFVLPSGFYSYNKGDATFIGLNTAEIFIGYKSSDQTDFIRKTLQQNPASLWKFAFGHHPYISNGDHGNAGSYEGLPFPIPIISGQNIKKFVEAEICGKIDFYLAGHDHNRQLLEPKCGTHFVVSGAGAKTDKIDDPNRNKALFQSDQLGFFFFYVDGKSLTVEIYDADGKLEFSKGYTK